MGKLIIIEGNDGSGKQTQTLKLYENLIKLGKKVKKISFPDYESNSSALVKMYLSGEFGKKANDVNPYAASSFYAVDRFASFKVKWEKEYNEDYIILSDRYTGSNMIHHGFKIDNLSDRENFFSWIEDLEYDKLSIPKPDLTIFLNVPIDYTLNLIKERENKYTGKSEKDIHERDVEYLKKSYFNALEIAKNKNWIVINCVENGNMKEIDEIAKLIFEKVSELL